MGDFWEPPSSDPVIGIQFFVSGVAHPIVVMFTTHADQFFNVQRDPPAEEDDTGDDPEANEPVVVEPKEK